jgi:hypothetical protein
VALGFGENFRPAGRTSSQLVGDVVMFGIVLTAATQASEVLGVVVLTAVIASIGNFAVSGIAALAIMLAGLWISNLAAASFNTSSGGLPLSSIARGVVLFFAVPMALRQLGLPAEIIVLGFGGVVGAVAVAVAIAFGIGGQDVARRTLERLQVSANSKLER